MTAILDLPPVSVDQGEQTRRWRRIPARFSPACDEAPWESMQGRPYDPLAMYRRTYGSLEEAAATRLGTGHVGPILLVKCDADGNPLVVEGVQGQYPAGAYAETARRWGRRWGVDVIEPVRDFSTPEVMEYRLVMTEVAKPTGQTWCEPPRRSYGHGG